MGSKAKQKKNVDDYFEFYCKRKVRKGAMTKRKREFKKVLKFYFVFLNGENIILFLQDRTQRRMANGKV